MSKIFTIRQMQPRDCGRVAYIDEQCIRNAWSKEDFDSLEDEDTDMKVEVENLPKELAEHTMRYFLNILREN